ncbi:MAG: hypothetical protein IKF71_03805 [Bacilli bacterium]|nr:hypothetical protein [Bacilli bacterium]
MNNKLLFIVMDGEIKFLKDSTMDHKEWYQSLGGSMDQYDQVIRGYVMEGKIIYFKANLNYDDEVISFALKTGLKMKLQLHDMSLKVCCGIDPGHDGSKWEPILILNDEDLEGYKTKEELSKEKEEKVKQQQMDALKDTDTQPVMEFKNDEHDPKFIKMATNFTLIMLATAFLSKLILIPGQTMAVSNRWNALLVLAQFGGLILSIVGYNKKMSKTKVFAFVAAVASIFMFDFLDIVVGILTGLFTIDHTMVLKIKDTSVKVFKKVSQWVQEVSSKGLPKK